MADRVQAGPGNDPTCIRDSVSINTRKIYDSCKDKDCIEDLRLYPDCNSQAYISGAVSVRARSAQLLYASVDVKEVSFNRGYYTVDVRYFYRITGEAYSLVSGTDPITGLAVFDKRVILFGSEGNAKVFTSDSCNTVHDPGLPTAVLEAVDPIVLGIKLVEVCECPNNDRELEEIPEFIRGAFPTGLALGGDSKRVYITLGQFSIIRLERDSQMLIPFYEYSMPEKECIGSGEDDPCDLFRKIRFPVNEFFPPDTIAGAEDYRELRGT